MIHSFKDCLEDPGRQENTCGRGRGNSSKETLKELGAFEVLNARPLGEIPAF